MVNTNKIARPSLYTDYPYHLYANDKMSILGRETYSVLEFLGDVGGLNEALRIIFGLLIAPFATMQLQSFLANRLFTASEDYLNPKITS